MAAYPNVVQVLPSRTIADEGTVVDRAVSGKPRFRSYYSKTRISWEVVHECENTDRDLLWQFYQDNKFVSFTFTWAGDGQTYEVRFTAPPQEQPIEGNLRWRVTNQFTQV